MRAIFILAGLLLSAWLVPQASAQDQNLSTSEWGCVLADEPARSERKTCIRLDNRVKAMAYAYGEENGDWREIFECFVMNSGEGCYYLADSILDKENPETQIPAKLIEERGCRIGYEDSCADMELPDTSTVPPKDLARIVKSACLRGAEEACEYVILKDISPREYAQCLGLTDAVFQSITECTTLEMQVKDAARIYAFHDGMGENWLDCFELGILGGCTNLEDISYNTYDDDEIALPGLAIMLNARDCRMGDMNVCDDLANTLTNERYFDRRRDVFVRLCKFGSAEACPYAPNDEQINRRKTDDIYWAVDYFRKSDKQ